LSTESKSRERLREAAEQWAAVPLEEKERVLELHGIVPAGHPSRRPFRHPLMWLRMERRRRRLARQAFDRMEVA